MTSAARPDPEAGARFIEKLMADDPARLDVATDEQVDAMMDAAGIEVGEPESAEAALARGERRARERAARARARAGRGPAARPAPKRAPSARAKWMAGAVVAAAAAAAAAAIVATEMRGSSPHGPEDIGPDRPGPGLTPQENASRLRADALRACKAQDFTACTAKLDEAKRLDPAGESDPRVVAARELLPPATPVPSSTSPSSDKPKP
jgi:hypothetical protein